MPVPGRRDVGLVSRRVRCSARSHQTVETDLPDRVRERILPVIRYLKAANGSGSASRMPDLVRVVGVRWVGMGARYVRFRPGRFRGVGSVRSRPLKEVS